MSDILLKLELEQTLADIQVEELEFDEEIVLSAH